MEDDRKHEQSKQDQNKPGNQPKQGGEAGHGQQGQKQPGIGQEQKRPQSQPDEQDKERKSA